jgi:hypothetical protein
MINLRVQIMSKYKINAIATRALVDPAFRQAILNGRWRQELLEYDLPRELVAVIMSIKGNDPRQFINQLHQLIILKRWYGSEIKR